MIETPEWAVDWRGAPIELAARVLYSRDMGWAEGICIGYSDIKRIKVKVVRRVGRGDLQTVYLEPYNLTVVDLLPESTKPDFFDAKVTSLRSSIDRYKTKLEDLTVGGHTRVYYTSWLSQAEEKLDKLLKKGKK